MGEINGDTCVCVNMVLFSFGDFRVEMESCRFWKMMILVPLRELGCIVKTKALEIESRPHRVPR